MFETKMQRAEEAGSCSADDDAPAADEEDDDDEDDEPSAASAEALGAPRTGLADAGGRTDDDADNREFERRSISDTKVLRSVRASAPVHVKRKTLTQPTTM